MIFELVGLALALLLRVWAFEWLLTAFHTGKWWPLLLAALCWNGADVGQKRWFHN